MSKVGYETLEIYQLSCQLAELTYEAVGACRGFDRDTLGKQLVRAADSIGANIAEGYGRGNGADQKRFLRIARGSVYETKHWLRLAYTRKLLTPETVERLKPVVEKLPPMLNAYMKAVTRNRQSTLDDRQSESENTD